MSISLALALKLRELDSTLGLTFNGNYDLNWGRKNEKWMAGSGGLWFYITPDGKLWRWAGKSDMSGDVVIAELTAEIYETPRALHDSIDPATLAAPSTSTPSAPATAPAPAPVSTSTPVVSGVNGLPPVVQTAGESEEVALAKAIRSAWSSAFGIDVYTPLSITNLLGTLDAEYGAAGVAIADGIVDVLRSTDLVGITTRTRMLVASFEDPQAPLPPNVWTPLASYTIKRIAQPQKPKPFALFKRLFDADESYRGINADGIVAGSVQQNLDPGVLLNRFTPMCYYQFGVAFDYKQYSGTNQYTLKPAFYAACDDKVSISSLNVCIDSGGQLLLTNGLAKPVQNNYNGLRALIGDRVAFTQKLTADIATLRGRLQPFGPQILGLDPVWNRPEAGDTTYQAYLVQLNARPAVRGPGHPGSPGPVTPV